ncbi:MAG: T9SS type A sorting domain-containing protein [Gemmatimonadales bacterium]|nr:T9SS type A sorting domain-containing protein [Gemmatimonadales bacterium]
MKRSNEIWLRILLLASLLVTGNALAQDDPFDLNPKVTFHWSPSPLEGANKEALAPAVAYQVWIVLDEEAPEMIATVKDTLFELSVEPGIVHKLGVRGVGADSTQISQMSELSNPVFFELGYRSVPAAAFLGSIYPNPFNPETNIQYSIPADIATGDPITLEIFNLAGKRVRVLDTENIPGNYEAVWNGADDTGMPASSGMYVTRFVCGSFVETKKMTMLK